MYGIIKKKIIFALHFGKSTKIADVVKLVDTLDLGSSAERCVGSSPSIRTMSKMVLRIS